MRLGDISRSDTRKLERERALLEQKRDDPRRVRKGKILSDEERDVLQAIQAELTRRVEETSNAARSAAAATLNRSDPETRTATSAASIEVEQKRERMLYPFMVAEICLDTDDRIDNLDWLQRKARAQLQNDRTGILSAVDTLNIEIADWGEEMKRLYEETQARERGTSAVEATFPASSRQYVSDLVTAFGEVVPPLDSVTQGLSPREFVYLLVAVGIRLSSSLAEHINRVNDTKARASISMLLSYMMREVYGQLSVLSDQQYRAAVLLLLKDIDSHCYAMTEHTKNIRIPLPPDQMTQLEQFMSRGVRAVRSLYIAMNSFQRNCEAIETAENVLTRFPFRDELPLFGQIRRRLLGTYVWVGQDGARFSSSGDTVFSLVPLSRGEGITTTVEDVSVEGDPPIGRPLSYPPAIREKAIVVKGVLPQIAARMQRMLEILCPQWRDQEEVLTSCTFVEMSDHVAILYPIAKGKPLLPDSRDLPEGLVEGLLSEARIPAADAPQWAALSVPSLQALESRLLNARDVDGRFFLRGETEESPPSRATGGDREHTGRRTSVPRLACLHTVLLQLREKAEFAWDSDGADLTPSRREYSSVHRGHDVVVTLPELSLQFIINDDPSKVAFFTRQPRDPKEYIGQVNSRNLRENFGCKPLNWNSHEQFSRALTTLIQAQRRPTGAANPSSGPDLLSDPAALESIRRDIEAVAEDLGKPPSEVTMPDMRRVLSGACEWQWLGTVECGDTYVRRIVDSVRNRITALGVLAPTERLQTGWQLVMDAVYPSHR